MKTQISVTLGFVLFSAVAQGQMTDRVAANEDVAFVEAKNNEKVAKPELKRNVVHLYSKKEKGAMIITSHRKHDVTIYVFDVDGTILYQAVLKNDEKKRIENIAKGTYTYSIFENDESVEEGKLIIR
jgi:hypothetical protein